MFGYYCGDFVGNCCYLASSLYRLVVDWAGNSELDIANDDKIAQ